MVAGLQRHREHLLGAAERMSNMAENLGRKLSALMGSSPDGQQATLVEVSRVTRDILSAGRRAESLWAMDQVQSQQILMVEV